MFMGRVSTNLNKWEGEEEKGQSELPSWNCKQRCWDPVERKLPGSCSEFPCETLVLVREEKALYGKREVPSPPVTATCGRSWPSPGKFPSGLQSGWEGGSWVLRRNLISSLLMKAFTRGRNALQCPGPRSSSCQAKGDCPFDRSPLCSGTY